MTRTSRHDDAEIADGLIQHDVHAMAAFYDRYGALAYSVALRILGDPGRAEDAVQDVFLKLWRVAPSFDASRGQLRTWLLTAVRNRCVDYMRGRGGHERHEIALPREIPSGIGDPWQDVSMSLERAAVRDAMESLPGEQRRVVELAYFSGYTGREIAGMIGAPLSTIKGRMRLGLEKLHSYLQGKGLDADA